MVINHVSEYSGNGILMVTFESKKWLALVAVVSVATVGCDDTPERVDSTPVATGAVTDDSTHPIGTETDNAVEASVVGDAPAESAAAAGSTVDREPERAEVISPDAGAADGQVTSPTTAPAESLVDAIYETVKFEGASTNLARDAEYKLAKLAQNIEEGTPITLTVRIKRYSTPTEGAGDDVLSQVRGGVIKDYLEKEGVTVADWVVDTVGGDQSVKAEISMAMKEKQQPVVISIE